MNATLEEIQFEISQAKITYELGNFKVAKDCLKRALSSNVNLQGESKIEAYKFLGLSNIKLGNFAESKENFEQVLKFDPNNWDAIHDLGCAFQGLGQFDAALEQFKKANSLCPSISTVLLNIAQCQYALSDFDAAINSIKAYLNTNQLNEGANIFLSRCLIEAGRLDEALTATDTALRVNPASNEALYYKAYIYQQQGDTNKTIQTLKILQEVLSQQNCGELAQRVQGMIDNIANTQLLPGGAK